MIILTMQSLDLDIVRELMESRKRLVDSIPVVVMTGFSGEPTIMQEIPDISEFEVTYFVPEVPEYEPVPFNPQFILRSGRIVRTWNYEWGQYTIWTPPAQRRPVKIHINKFIRRFRGNNRGRHFNRKRA